MTKDADYWIEARQRLIAMGEIDSNYELVFGSKHHKYRPLKPVAEDRLIAFESKNEAHLPPEYRSFLTSFGAGGAGPDYGIYDFADVQDISVKERFYLTDSKEWPEEDDDPMWDLPGLLPISTSGCAIDWSIEVNGPQPGTMWVDAGPGDQLMRCEPFGTWYEQWIDRIELGLKKYRIMSRMIDSGASIPEIAEECDAEPYEFDWDGVGYMRFKGIPGRIRPDGDRIVAFDIYNCWIL